MKINAYSVIYWIVLLVDVNLRSVQMLEAFNHITSCLLANGVGLVVMGLN